VQILYQYISSIMPQIDQYFQQIKFAARVIKTTKLYYSETLFNIQSIAIDSSVKDYYKYFIELSFWYQGEILVIRA